VLPLFAADERTRWSRKRKLWRRARSSFRDEGVCLKVWPSLIPNAGMGLFATTDMYDGQQIGRVSGKVLFSATSEVSAENFALELNDDKVIMLRSAGQWVVVDVRGSVFEYMNCSKGVGDANVHVSPSGYVSCDSCVFAGDELVWFYGELHASAHAYCPV